MSSGFAVLFVGLPGAGKTTLGTALEATLRAQSVQPVARLDGDVLRASGGLCAGLGFSAEDRRENLRRTRVLARHLVDVGAAVIVANVMPFHSAREAFRECVPCTLLVDVATPPAVCAARDPKGLWAAADAGALRGLTGFDARFDPVVGADLRTETAGSVACDVDLVCVALRSRGWLQV